MRKACFFTNSLNVLFSRAINSSYRPCSTICPLSKTAIESALRMVDKRWAMVRQVLPLANFSRAFCTSSSDTESKALVASSSMRMVGFYKKNLKIIKIQF